MSDSAKKFGLAMMKNGKVGEEPSKMLNYVRDLSKAEIDSLNNANKILTELTARSPYKHFQDRFDDFFSQIEEINKKSANGGLRSHELDDVYGKLDDLLSSLKGFEDRTKSLISSRYGKDSKQMEVFQAALSYEFDNKFEYRFCYNLRNYSQHKGSHVGQIKSVSEFVDGKPVSTLEIILNGTKLLEQYSKWHSMVKQDLATKNYDFALTPIIKELKFSCFRVFSKYLLSQEDEILKAIKDIEDVVGDFDPQNEGPTIMRIHDGFTKNGGEISLTAIKINLIESIKPILRSAHHFGSMK